MAGRKRWRSCRLQENIWDGCLGPDGVTAARDLVLEVATFSPARFGRTSDQAISLPFNASEGYLALLLALDTLTAGVADKTSFTCACPLFSHAAKTRQSSSAKAKVEAGHATIFHQ